MGLFEPQRGLFQNKSKNGAFSGLWTLSQKALAGYTLGMRKTNIILTVLALFCGSVVAAPSEAEIEEKIRKTAEGLGMSYYEEFPVYGSSMGSLKGGGTGSASESLHISNSLPVPEPQLSLQSSEPPSLTFSEHATLYMGYAHLIWNGISSQVTDSGFFSKNAPSFDEISKNLIKRASVSSYGTRKSGEKTLFSEAGFVSEFEKVTGSKFMDGNAVKFLVDGGESFKYKDYLMKNAKKSIYVTTWAFYDDRTGLDTFNILAEKKKQGVDVKIIADGTVMDSHGVSIINKLGKAGIEVVKHSEKRRTSDIWHVKVIVVDGRYAIAGGMNFGDPYSHKDPQGEKWRDTDVLYMGPAVDEAVKFFAGIWNGEVSRQKLKFGKIDASSSNAPQGKARISLSYSNPPDAQGTSILAGIIKAMYGATKVINIENAYFVPIPALSQAILDARARGVEVNILTNSEDSVNHKQVSDISMKSMLPLYQAGANIYLKQGETLHSKFMTVDGIYCSIGSYNMHPRGERYDSEVNVNIIDEESVASLDEVFKRDVANLSKQVTSAKELMPDQGWISNIVEKYFFAQLGKK